MHHFKLHGLRSKKSKVELKPEDHHFLGNTVTSGDSKDESKYEALNMDPSKAIAIDRAVSPATIIAGVSAGVGVAEHITELIEEEQDARAGRAKLPTKSESNNDNVVKDALDVVDNIKDIVQNANSQPQGKLDVPPAILAHNAKMQLKASSILPQQPPKGGGNTENKGPALLPPALAKALKHMDIVTARSRPPASQAGPMGANRHMRAIGGMSSSANLKTSAQNLPPNLAKALRSIQIAGARTPEGRKLAAVAAEAVGTGVGPAVPKIRLRAATDAVDEDEDLPAELKASRRHMQIFAASHRAAGPATLGKLVKDPGMITENAAREADGDNGEFVDAQDAVTQTENNDEPLAPKPSPTPVPTVKGPGAGKPGSIAQVQATPTATDDTPPTDLSHETSKPPSKANSAGGVEPGAPPLTVKPSGSKESKSLSPPTVTDIVRYRYHHGTNLGSIYVLEKWLTPSAFPPDAPDAQTSELACVSEWVKEIGLEATAKKFEERWSKALSEEEWTWLTETAHVNALRLPVGYFTLGPSFCKDTPFEEFASVYKQAWSLVKELIKAAFGKGIGVLIDMHALPGGANAGDHSGTNSGVARLWSVPTNQELATQCIEFVTREIKDLPGVIGIGICNEADWESKGIYEWYDKTVNAVATIDPVIPLFISDAWDLGKAVKYAQKNNKVDKKQNPLVVETHIYFCFEDEDRALSPTQIIEEVPSTVKYIDTQQSGTVHSTGAPAVIVGEYSCALDPATYTRSNNGSQEDDRNKFGHAQSEIFSQKAGGTFFWTLKMDWMDGGAWGFVEMTKTGAIKAPDWLAFSKEEVEGRTQNADSKVKTLKEGAIRVHATGDGKSTIPQPKSGQITKSSPHLQPTSHGRQKSKSSQRSLVGSRSQAEDPFTKGWELGWDDTRSFFRFQTERDLPNNGAARIGCKSLWVLKRLREADIMGGGLKDFEAGLWKGMEDFEDVAFD